MTSKLTKMKEWTQARIGLNMTGHSISTRELLKFRLAHAQARDAIHSPWHFLLLQEKLQSLGEESILVETGISNRDSYLKRPDLGRKLTSESIARLSRDSQSFDLSFIVSDGLSSLAIERHFLPFWKEFRTKLKGQIYAPLVIAPFSRVAVSDEVGFHLKAKVSVIFIGERPGLSSADSMGIYLTFGPRPGLLDSQRNCISNIRPPDGLSYAHAADKLLFLINESLRLKLSGVQLKEDAGLLSGGESFSY